MTGDDRSAAPPHELVGPLGQVIERIAGELVGGSPGSSVAPVPLAPASTLTASHVQLPGSPGIAPAFVPAAPLAAPAAPPFAAPVMPASSADDPSVLAQAIERLAGELFGGGV